MLLCSGLGAATGFAREMAKMQTLELHWNGRPVALVVAPRLDGDQVYVPLDEFCATIGAEAKVLEGDERLAVCRGELCVPLEEGDTRADNGAVYLALAAVSEPLGLSWVVDKGVVQVRTAGGSVGLGIGTRPPHFELPDLYSGEQVSLPQYRGKKAIFYMWASW